MLPVCLSQRTCPPLVSVPVSRYSIWHVFYEQYLFVGHDTWQNLGICLAAVFIVTFLLLGFDIWSAAIALISIAAIVNSMFGLMYFWGISLNAVSLVNLVMVSNSKPNPTTQTNPKPNHHPDQPHNFTTTWTTQTPNRRTIQLTFGYVFLFA